MAVDLFSCDCECGCAAKIPADRLKSILGHVAFPSCPELIVSPATLDDAGVYKIDEHHALVQTVDFFPPVARDPYVYGQIAAANALSDVYAMGGKPLTALAIVCFPARSIHEQALTEITRGAVDKIREAGAVLAGGHSVVDDQPKYGLAVTGMINPNVIMDNAGATVGDVLVLTKPLGTGITIMAAKAGIAAGEQEHAANQSMTALNAGAAAAAKEAGVRACTDITGFGLLGHVLQMARASRVSVNIDFDALPLLDGVLGYAAMGLLSGATYANRKYAEQVVRFAPDISLEQQDLLFDPQTSGGLLLACPRNKLEELQVCLMRHGVTTGKVIGAVIACKEEPAIFVRR